MRLSLLTVLLLVPGVSFGQTLSVLFPDNQAQETVSPRDCGDKRLVTWTLSQGVQSCGELLFWLTKSASCGDEPGAEDFTFDAIPQTGWGLTVTTSNFELEISKLPAFSGTGAVTCGDTATDNIDVRLCGRGEIANAVTGCSGASADRRYIEPSPVPTITYDSIPPSVPTIEKVGTLDEGLRIELQPDDDRFETILEIRRVGADGYTARPPATGNSITVENLENEVEYEVRATAFDRAGNQSEPSAPMTGKPLPTRGFWGNYKDANGAETGGCSAGVGVGLIPGVFSLVALALRRRRRR